MPLRFHDGDGVVRLVEQEQIVSEDYVEQGWDPETGLATLESIRLLAIEEDAAGAIARGPVARAGTSEARA